VLFGVSEMCFGTVDCDDAHCYIADGTVRWCGMVRESVTGLNWLQYGGRECLVCCVKLVKCVLVQLTVMMSIAILQTV